MMKRYYLLVAACLFSVFSFSQEEQNLSSFKKTNITKPSILSTHTFGVFFSRNEGHFEMNAPKKHRLNIGIESGNVWSPEIKVYIPKNEADRAVVRNYDWDQAHRAFDEKTIEKDSFQIANDGVTKGFKLNLNIRLTKKHELQVGIRTYLLTKGKSPFSILTGDGFIEDFHDNVAGGEDPFDRRIFGLDQANISYRDRNGNSMNIESGNIFATGIKTSYYYYPELLKNKNKTFAMNLGAHLGANLSKSNSSLDFGVSANAIKNFTINDKRHLNIGASLGTQRKSAVNFKSNNLDFGTKDFISYLETILEYSFRSKKGTVHSFGADFYIQTSLNDKDEFEYIIPIRQEKAFKSWGHGARNLYENNDYWSFIYSFGRKITTSFYLQQDFTVINNPDLQTGVNLSFIL